MQRKIGIWIAAAAVALAGAGGLQWAQSGEQGDGPQVVDAVEAAPVVGPPQEVEVSTTPTPFVVRAGDLDFFKRLLQARDTRIKPLARKMLIDPDASPAEGTPGLGDPGPRPVVGDGHGVSRSLRVDGGQSVSTSPLFHFRPVSSGNADAPAAGPQPRTREQRTAAVEAFRRSIVRGKPAASKQPARREEEPESDN